MPGCVSRGLVAEGLWISLFKVIEQWSRLLVECCLILAPNINVLVVSFYHSKKLMLRIYLHSDLMLNDVQLMFYIRCMVADSGVVRDLEFKRMYWRVSLKDNKKPLTMPELFSQFKFIEVFLNIGLSTPQYLSSGYEDQKILYRSKHKDQICVFWGVWIHRYSGLYITF